MNIVYYVLIMAIAAILVAALAQTAIDYLSKQGYWPKK